MSARLSGPLAWLLAPITVAAMFFILAPLLVTVAISVGTSQFAAFPPRGFTLDWYAQVLRDPDFQESLGFSTALAIGATAGALALGVPAAFALARHDFPGRGAAAAALLSPLILPVLITGVALLQMFATLNWNNTSLNMLIAHVLITTPYVVRTVAASLMQADTARRSPMTRSNTTTIAIANRIIRVEIAAIDGSKTLAIRWKTRIGIGLCCASASHSEMGKLSNDTMNANSAPAASPGAICGIVMRRNTRQRPAPSVRAASSRVISASIRAAVTVRTT